MKAATHSVPEPLLVKRELVEGNLFIRASSLGLWGKVLMKLLQVHKFPTVIRLKPSFIWLFSHDVLSGKCFFYYQNLPGSHLTNPTCY